jgi:hypothetical protein
MPDANTILQKNIYGALYSVVGCNGVFYFWCLVLKKSCITSFIVLGNIGSRTIKFHAPSLYSRITNLSINNKHVRHPSSSLLTLCLSCLWELSCEFHGAKFHRTTFECECEFYFLELGINHAVNNRSTPRSTPIRKLCFSSKALLEFKFISIFYIGYCWGYTDTDTATTSALIFLHLKIKRASNQNNIQLALFLHSLQLNLLLLLLLQLRSTIYNRAQINNQQNQYGKKKW